MLICSKFMVTMMTSKSYCLVGDGERLTVNVESLKVNEI